MTTIFIWITLCGFLLLILGMIWDFLNNIFDDKKMNQPKIMICPICHQVFLSPKFENMLHCPACGGFCFIKK